MILDLALWAQISQRARAHHPGRDAETRELSIPVDGPEEQENVVAADALHPELARILRVVEVFAPVDFDLSGDADLRLRAMHEFLSKDPDSVTHLQASRRRDWLLDMKEQIFGSFREGLVAVRYHLARIEQIEATIRSIAAEHEEELFAHGTVGFNCRPLNVEYQAFAFALRRSLEYLAGATAMYFKTQGNRIRTLSKVIAGKDPTSRSEAVRERLGRANLAMVIGTGDERSPRDRLAHYESIAAGVINIYRSFDDTLVVHLIGGGEELPGFGSGASAPDLATSLKGQVQWLEDLAFGVFSDLGLCP